MQVYQRLKETWKKLARKYQEGLFEEFLGSPIIELDECQYMEVEYFVAGYGLTNVFPDVQVRGTLVLCDGKTVVQEASVAHKVMKLGLRLVSSVSAESLRQIEHFAAFDEQDAQAQVGFADEISYCREHTSVLHRYVSRNVLASFVCVCEQQWIALQRRAAESSKKLQMMNALLQCQSIPARHIEALEQFHLNAHRWNIRSTQVLLEAGSYASQLHQQLLNCQTEWKQDKIASEVCTRVARWWQARATSAARIREEMEQDGYADYEQRQARLWQERIDERMALYRVPLKPQANDVIDLAMSELTDAELDEIVSGLPPLPDRPPWRISSGKRLANHIFIIVMIVLLLFGVGMAVLRMVIGGVSFSSVSQALFFVFWMFFFALRWKRR